MEDRQNLQEAPSGTSQATAGSVAPLPYSVVHKAEWDAMSPETQRAILEMIECARKEYGRGAKRTSSSALVPPAPSQMLAGADLADIQWREMFEMVAGQLRFLAEEIDTGAVELRFNNAIARKWARGYALRFAKIFDHWAKSEGGTNTTVSESSDG